METDLKVVVFGSPMAVGHVRPLMPLAARLVARGFDVVWAISLSIRHNFSFRFISSRLRMARVAA